MVALLLNTLKAGENLSRNECLLQIGVTLLA